MRVVRESGCECRQSVLLNMSLAHLHCSACLRFLCTAMVGCEVSSATPIDSKISTDPTFVVSLQPVQLASVYIRKYSCDDDIRASRELAPLHLLACLSNAAHYSSPATSGAGTPRNDTRRFQGRHTPTTHSACGITANQV